MGTGTSEPKRLRSTRENSVFTRIPPAGITDFLLVKTLLPILVVKVSHEALKGVYAILHISKSCQPL
jgi:hypothetical protein